MAAYQKSLQTLATGRTPRPTAEAMMAKLEPQLADASAAFALIRTRASEWHVDPTKIGMVGFSAGAMLTMATTLNGQPDAKPAFVGDIYGPVSAMAVPAPPIFVALAADDPLFGGGSFGLIDGWRAAKRPIEFHLFEQGGHGFGMYPKKTTSTGWFDEFARWMTMHDWMKPKG
jgi:acetyl esterase/lipase